MTHTSQESEDKPLTVRATPCASCPYRCSAPSGVWDESEYSKLLRYDGDVMEQSPALFLCHTSATELCAGWVGHKEHPSDLLALRLAALSGDSDKPETIDAEQVFSYSTDVPLHASGQEAYRAGCERLDDPDDAACAAQEKIIRLRSLQRPQQK